MLRLVLGRSGSGKTDYIYEQLAALVWGGENRAVLLVPEQYSFESERRLLAMFGPRLAAGVQVLSFTRLAEMVDRELGGTAGRPMDDITRMLLMSRALEEVGDRLTLYRRQIDDQAYIRAMLGLVSECRQYAVTPQRLLETAETLPPGGTLRRKTEELALIFDAYEALAANGYVDPQDALTRLAARMPESALLLDAAVFVDGFKGFTEQETAVLGMVFRKARQTMVTLCTDTLEETDGLSLFSSVTRTANRLVRLARENGVPVAAPVHLRENRRTASPALAALERGCFRPQPAVFEGESPEVELAPCADVYGECARAARRIRRLLREEGLRCREIAVVARSLAAYEGVLDAALEREGIPFYMDRRQDILTDPLITLTQGAIRCAAVGWDGEELLQMLKTGLLGFSPRSVAALENYVYLWNIRGSGWRRDWDWNPEGLSVKADEATARRLAWLNLLRRRTARPLERLTAAFSRDGGRISGRRFGEAVYRYLQEAQVPRLLRLQVRRLDAAGEPALADRMERLWELLMSLLDRFGTVMGETVLPARRFAVLFSLAAATADLGSIPQGLDAVQVGSADRMRFSAPRAVLILGANEGVFPAWPTADGLLTAGEREALAEAGLTLAAGGEQAALEERLFAYLAVAAPSERLFISYVGSSGGEAALPSVLVESVRRILPGCRDGGEEGLPVESEADAFDRLAAHYREPGIEAASLRRVFEERPGYRERLAALGQAAAGEPAAFRDAAAAKALFGGDMRLSPSRVEAYHRCRFSYFCRYGLGAKVLRPAELDAAEFGTLTHYVMERTLPVYTAEGFANIRRERVTADTAAAVAAYVDEYMGGRENKPSRFLHMLARLERTCGCLLWQVVLEFRQSRFVPVDYELAVGLPPEEDGGAVDPVVLTLPDGARIRVQGKVDRVDAYRAGEETYIRVVDYKTGAREFRLSDVMAGINLQMLIYLFAIWQNGAPRYGTVTPAGVLYLPAKLPVIRVERGADGERQERERLRAMRMNGLLLDNPEIVEAMEADAAGLFIPAKLGAKGFDRSSSIASLEQFGLLRQKIERLLREMAETLRAGDIAAVPAAGETVDACAFCDFRAVCGHEQGDAVRFVAKRDAAEVLRDLETAESDFSEN